jgi:hypothetical protein
MMHGWFHWDWTSWLSSVTGSDGEGAYRMVEYQFFVLLFVLGSVLWFPARHMASRKLLAARHAGT